MTKSDVIVRGTDAELEALRQKEQEIEDEQGESRRITFAMNMIALQEKAGLTYKEARAYLTTYNESPRDMAADLSMDVHSVYNLMRKATKKIDDSGLTLEEIWGDYVPTVTTIYD